MRGIWLLPGKGGDLPAEKGAYVLALRLDAPVGAEFPPGWYLYLGSARGPGGLGARIARHFRREKRLHWHVDRLTVAAGSLAALAVAGGDECDLTGRLLATGHFSVPVPGFGSSDCRTCPSHLLMPGAG